VLLPLSKRTHHILSGRLPNSSNTGTNPPVMLSHTIDISLTRYSHPRDTEWDSFETNHWDGMPQRHIVLSGRPGRVQPNGVIRPTDKPGEVDRWISQRLSRPVFCSSLSLDRRAVQRPEIYYSSSLSRALQLDQVKTHLAAANKLADDRRKAMYYSKSAVSHSKPASVPIPCDRTGVTSEERHTSPTSITRHSVAIKYISKVGQLPEARCPGVESVSRLAGPALVPDSGRAEGLRSNTALNRPVVDMSIACKEVGMLSG